MKLTEIAEKYGVNTEVINTKTNEHFIIEWVEVGAYGYKTARCEGKDFDTWESGIVPENQNDDIWKVA